jgi:hypothetical protein
VTVPERAIHEDGHLPTYEGDVDPPAGPGPVKAVPARAEAPKSGAELAFGARVRAADARHDAAAPLGRGWRRAERV